MIWQFTGATERVAMFVATSGGLAARGRDGARRGAGVHRAAGQLSAELHQCQGERWPVRQGRPDGRAGACGGRYRRRLQLSKVALPSGISRRARLPEQALHSRHRTRRGALAGNAAVRAGRRGRQRSRAGRVLPAGAPLRGAAARPALRSSSTRVLSRWRAKAASSRSALARPSPAPSATGPVGKALAQSRPSSASSKNALPAGLNGAHSVRFILAKGVPMPDGRPGHSTVISEETGQPVTPR